MFKLHSKFNPAGDQPKAISRLTQGVEKDYRYQSLLGITGSGKTFTVASVIKNFEMPVLVIAPNKTLAAQLYKEYKTFFPENKVCYFVSYYDYYQPEAYSPITDTYIEKEASINEEIDKLRHEATSSLMSRKDTIIVSSVSCIYNLGLPSHYFEASIYIEKGKPLVRSDFIKQLVKIHYKRTHGELKRGHFRVRGDVFEIVPPNEEIIYRIELKDQKIDSILLLDPTTHKIKEEINELIIFPPQHFITTTPERERAVREIKEELRERIRYFRKQNKYLEAERLERRTKNDLEMINTLGYCHGIENYSRHFTGRLMGEPPETLLSFFPHENGKPQFLTIIDESHISIPQLRGMYEGDKARKETLIEYGFRLPSALDNRPLNFSEFINRIGTTIFTSATPGEFEFKNSSQVVEQIIRPTYLVDPQMEIKPVFEKNTNTTQIDELMKEIEEKTSLNERVLVNTLTKKTAEELTAFLEEKKIKVNYIHSETKTLERTEIIKDFRKGKIEVLVGVNLLREGLDLPEVSLVAILDSDREGFLRSKTALIQLMGRASRNVKGKVILFANEMTESLKEAKKEVDRRRNIQLEYNKKHNLTPKGIDKKVESLID